MPESHASWALVNRPVTDLRMLPHRHAERVSQALLGESLQVLEACGEWARVRLDGDGYRGWLRQEALHCCTEDEVISYTQSATHWVAAETVAAAQDPTGFMHSSPVIGPARSSIVGKLFFGLHAPAEDRSGSHIAIRKPDGEIWWCPAQSLQPLGEAPRADNSGLTRCLDYLLGFIGVPYLWGGRTPFGYDCSGLAQAFYAAMGIHIRRDAGEQYDDGKPAKPPYCPGDLLFFMDTKPQDRLPGDPEPAGNGISHVAISLGGEMILHTTSGYGSLHVNCLEPGHPLFEAWLEEELVGAKRFV